MKDFYRFHFFLCPLASSFYALSVLLVMVGWLLTTGAIYSTKEILQCSPFYSKFSRQFSTPCKIYDLFCTSHTFNTKNFLHLLTFCPYLPRGIFLFYFAQAIFFSPFPCTLSHFITSYVALLLYFLPPF